MKKITKGIVRKRIFGTNEKMGILPLTVIYFLLTAMVLYTFIPYFIWLSTV